MPLGETLPKSHKSEEWLTAADKKRDELMKESGKRGIFGRQMLKPGSQVFKALSDKELMLRRKGMELKRQELKRMGK